MARYGDDLHRYSHDLAEDRENRVLGREPRRLPFVKPSDGEVKQAFIDSLTQAELCNYNSSLTLQSYQPTALTGVTQLMELTSPIPLLIILAEQHFLPGQRDAFTAAKVSKLLVTVAGHYFSPNTTSKLNSIVGNKRLLYPTPEPCRIGNLRMPNLNEDSCASQILVTTTSSVF